MRSHLSLLGLLSLSVFAPSCGDAPLGPRALFVASPNDALEGASFLDLPFPLDSRRNAAGHPIYTGHLNEPNRETPRFYAAEATRLLSGFSTSSALYVRFREPVLASSLPQSVADSISPKSSVQLIDIDPTSPNMGSLHPVSVYFRETAGRYWHPNTLAVLPALGRPLRPKGRYALVVTNAVRARTGQSFAADADLASMLRGETFENPSYEQVRRVLEPAFATLDAKQIARNSVVQLSVFSTDDPVTETFQLRDYVMKEFEAPVFRGIVRAEETARFDVYAGDYGPTPNFQAGTPPYLRPQDGGEFVWSAGKPVVQNRFDARFVLSIPKAAACPEPANGYPIVIYAHGTGGNYRSLVRERSGVAELLAGQCMAGIGVDQIFHGTRPGAPTESTTNPEAYIQNAFFNLGNPAAARTNARQSAIDVVQEARLFSQTKVTIPSDVSRTGSPIRFDGSKILFLGHSQGGINGPLFLAADDQARGAVLSGTGATFSIALLEKTSPSPGVAGAVRLILGLNEPQDVDELNLFHPIINLSQALVETADPLVYFPSLIMKPREGFRAKSVFLPEGIGPDGIGDTYTPPRSIETASEAMGLDRLLPLNRSYDSLRASSDRPSDLAFAGNLAGGTATGFLMQFAPAPNRDGHFVLFDVREARSVAGSFLTSVAKDGIGAYSPP